MKRIITIIFTFSILNYTFAQNASLFITTAKTTSLIFPYPVKYIDRGSKDVLVQQVKEAGNILLVKAATSQLLETNLTVITNEGSVYAFTVKYEEAPRTLVWQIPVQHEANVITYANNIMDNPQAIHGIHTGKFNFLARVVGIYIRNETIYYQILFSNRSSINYDIDYLRYSIRDRRKAKRTAVQEVEMNPLYIAGNVSMISANSENKIVVALPKFTIPGGKYFLIQIAEKNGGRNLSLRVHNRQILKAIPLPGLQ